MLNSLALLPLEESGLDEAITSAIAKLGNDGLSAEESRLKLESLFQGWLEKEGKAEPLPGEIQPLLAGASWAAKTTKTPHTAYVELIRKLEGKYAGSRREAAILVSRLPLIILLAEKLDNSPARIARLLGSGDGNDPVSWKAVQSMLLSFGIRSELDEELVSRLITEDRERSSETFGDADAATLTELISDQSAAFGLGADFGDSLGNLLEPQNGDPFIPYVQILLYACVVDHFYDHPSEFIYTFKPRGAVANLIFETFPPQLASGGNPMLNNFKAVNRLSHDWAESRDDNRDQAIALVKVVLGLSSLSYPARKQLSATIRRGILRFIEIRTPSPVSIPAITNVEGLEKFLSAIAQAPSNTRGVIEQRVTDFLGVLRHRGTAWRSRGLGDPVNASNTSSRKLGDCDFQNATTLECHAIEAHAGRLTDVYLHEHLRTLRLNLPKRLDEWSGIAEITEWKLNVLFVVHENSLPENSHSLELAVLSELNVITFAEASNQALEAAADMPDEAVKLFNQWVVQPLNAPNTPHSVKQKALQLFTD
jgi:hypothetical protein